MRLHDPYASNRASCLYALFLLLGAWPCLQQAAASPVADGTRTRLLAGQPTWVIVEYDGSAADRDAQTERLTRNLRRDDAAVLTVRARGYRAVKASAEASARGVDVLGVIDYRQLPASAWRLSSVAALDRLRASPGVRAVHENGVLRAVSVSDLGFIRQPQALAVGATGNGTTIAVVDGGLAANYLIYPDFGPCTAVNTPAGTCRVVLNTSTYPNASTMTAHGTNVAAIALGVAPGARLAMYDVFNGGSASFADLLGAINSIIVNQATYNIVALNLSLGDGSSHAATCTGSVFAAAVANARNVGITTVAAAGNSGSKSGLSDPACAPGVVSVGAVYDASYGNAAWVAASRPNGQCSDASAPDLVACFSQSANYLSMLAPGSYVKAPDAGFQQTGTSQATPHVAGAIAVLRARYPSEPPAAALQRLQVSGVPVTDPGNNLRVSRLDLFAAVQLGTALGLSGSGPGSAAAGTTTTFRLTVQNTGPLMATGVVVNFAVPPGATAQSVPADCVASGTAITCRAATLGVGATVLFTIRLSWATGGAFYTTATLAADQINSAGAAAQTIAFGTPPQAGDGGDAPLPAWAWVALACGLLLASRPGAQAPAARNLNRGTGITL